MKINIETSIILLVFIQLLNIFVHANPINKADFESDHAIVQDGEMNFKKAVPLLKKESSLLANDEKLIETSTSGEIGQRQHVLRKRGEVHPYKVRDRFRNVIAEVDPDELTPNIFGVDSDDEDQYYDYQIPPTLVSDLVASSTDDDAASFDDNSESLEILVESNPDDSISGDSSDDKSEDISMIDQRVGDERNEK